MTAGDMGKCNQIIPGQNVSAAAPEEIELFKPESILDVIDASFFSERDDPRHGYIRSKRYYEYYYALGRFYKPTTILEIGVRLGYSLGSLIAGSGCVRYACGLDKQCYVLGSNSHANGQLAQFMPCAVKVDIRTQDSQKLQALEQEFDMIHVDGDHTQAGAMHDMELCRDRCSVMLVDDYDLYPSVKNAVDEFVQKRSQKIHKWYYVRTYRGLAVIEFKVFDGEGKPAQEAGIP